MALTQSDLTSVGTHSPGADGSQVSHRRRDIQGLRAIAVLLVVTYHAGLPIPGGFVGVDVFFVISGFVITAMLAREWAGTGRIRFGTFYRRRFQRLTPALSLLIAVVAIATQGERMTEQLGDRINAMESVVLSQGHEVISALADQLGQFGESQVP